MKKFVYIAGILLAVMAVLVVSCKNDVTLDGGLSDLNLRLENSGSSKALGTDSTYVTGMTVASYEYRAVCNTTAGARGAVDTWTTLTVSGTTEDTDELGGNLGSATLSKLARGNWTIHVRALNSEGGVILEGSATCDLRSNGQDLPVSLSNNISHYSTTTNGTAAAAANITVSVGVTVPTLSNGSISVKYVTLANIGTLSATGSAGTAIEMTAAADHQTAISGTGISHDTELAGHTAYYGTVSLQPGLYAIQVLYKDNEQVISGQTIAFRVVEKAPFAINGTLTAGEFLNLDLANINEDSRTITLAWCAEPDGTPAANAGVISADVDASSVQGTLGDCTYTWFIDGVKETNSLAEESSILGKLASTRTFGSGKHVVTCVVSATIGGYDSVGYLSAEVDID